MKCSIFFLFCLHAPAAAATLRASAGKHRDVALNSTQNATEDAGKSQIDEAMDAVAAMMKAHAPKKHVAAHATNSSAPGHRAKLDVGFTAFEKDINQTVESGVKAALKNEQWTTELQEKLIENITSTMCEKFRAGLKPIKQSIGKTWMALPEDQQDDYVNRIKESFASDWSGGKSTLFSHFTIGLRRVDDYSKLENKLSPEKLLKSSESTLLDSLVNPRCYGGDDDSLLQIMGQAVPTTTRAPKNHKLKRFCMDPAITTVIKRFNDTEGLNSMSFRFEANALSLVQTGANRRVDVIGHK